MRTQRKWISLLLALTMALASLPTAALAVEEDALSGLELIPVEEGLTPEGGFSNGLALVTNGDKWGYIDQTGKLVIPCVYEDNISYDYISASAAVQCHFSEGLANVMKDGEMYCIDTSGNVVFAGEFLRVLFSEGLALTNKYDYIDRTGTVVIPSQGPGVYEGHGSFHEGLAMVRQYRAVEGSDVNQVFYGFINQVGELVVPCEYTDPLVYFSEGVAAVQKDDQYVVIDTEGNRVSGIGEYAFIGTFHDGLALVETQAGKYNYIDHNGNLLLETDYEGRAYDFSDGMALLEDKYYNPVGFINTQGEMLPADQYDEVGDFHEGLALVGEEIPVEETGDPYSVTYRYGYIDKTGNVVIPVGTLSGATDFNEGAALVQTASGWHVLKNPLGEPEEEVLPEASTLAVENGTLTVTLKEKPTAPPMASQFAAKAYIGETGEALPLGGFSYDGDRQVTFTFADFTEEQLEQGVSVGLWLRGVETKAEIAIQQAVTYTITASAGSHGSISPSGSVQVEEGQSQSFLMTPNTGYRIQTVTVDEYEIDGSDYYAFEPVPDNDSARYYTFEEVTENHSISVVFALASTDQGSGGGSGGSGGGSSSGGSSGGGGGSVASRPSVSASDGGSVKAGSDGTVTMTPDEGYQIKQVTVNGKKVSIPADGKLTGLKSTDRVVVTFEKIPDASGHGFTDVPDGYWAEEAIQWVYESGLMKGKTSSQFAPGESVSRQQLWMVLARLSGQEPAGMAGAKDWAVNSKVSDGTMPGGPVSRQQMVTILYRYAQNNQLDVDGGVDLTAFPDSAAVAGYAESAMAWAVANGILNGTADGFLNPGGATNRAQFTVILNRFYNWAGNV